MISEILRKGIRGGVIRWNRADTEENEKGNRVQVQLYNIQSQASIRVNNALVGYFYVYKHHNQPTKVFTLQTNRKHDLLLYYLCNNILLISKGDGNGSRNIL